jgi:uncharacterized protein DUF6263
MTFLSLALLLAPAQPGDSYTLQWKLKEGDTFYVKRVAQAEGAVSFDGEPKIDDKDKSEVTVVLRFRVKSVAAGATVVEMTYVMTETKTEKVTSVSFPKSYTFTATLDDRMKVIKFEGYDKMLDALSEGDEARKKVVRGLTPESSFRRDLDYAFPACPGKPVAIGTTWDQTESTSFLGGTIDFKLTRKLDGVKGDVATVLTKGDLSWKKGDEPGSVGKVIKGDMKVEKYAHAYRFDMKKGRPLDSKLELNLDFTLTAEVAGMPLKLRSKENQTVTTTVTDKDPLKN